MATSSSKRSLVPSPTTDSTLVSPSLRKHHPRYDDSSSSDYSTDEEDYDEEIPPQTSNSSSSNGVSCSKLCFELKEVLCWTCYCFTVETRHFLIDSVTVYRCSSCSILLERESEWIKLEFKRSEFDVLASTAMHSLRWMYVLLTGHHEDYSDYSDTDTDETNRWALQFIVFLDLRRNYRISTNILFSEPLKNTVKPADSPSNSSNISSRTSFTIATASNLKPTTKVSSSNNDSNSKPSSTSPSPSTDSTSPSSTSTPDTPSSSTIVPQDLVEILLKTHNDFRKLHQVSPLDWNETLSESSDRWVNNCVFEHSGGKLLQGGYGENLFG